MWLVQRYFIHIAAEHKETEWRLEWSPRTGVDELGDNMDMDTFKENIDMEYRNFIWI